MSKKTLIILLVIIAIGIVVILVAGRGADVTPDDVLPVDEDAIIDFNDEIIEIDENDFIFDPVEDEDGVMEEIEDEMTEGTLE